MSSFDPFDARFGVLERKFDFLDLLVRNQTGVVAYRLWGASTIEDAYGTLTDSGLTGSGGALLLEVPTGGLKRTRSLIRSRRGLVEESRKGHTSFQFDPADFPATLGPGDRMFFLRLQENHLTSGWRAVPLGAPFNAGYPLRGPIMPVIPVHLLGATTFPLNFQANAPLLTGCTGGSNVVMDVTAQTPLPLHLAFPCPLTALTIRNLSVGDDMLVSFDMGMPMTTLPAGDSLNISGGGNTILAFRELVAAAEAGSGAVVPFSVEAVVLGGTF